MTKATLDHFERVFRSLMKFGFLLESDPKLPSVGSIITGEPMRGSWWTHPLAQTIFNVSNQLDDHEDITITKLVSGKVTFVHRQLWPEIFSIGVAGESCQTNGLPSIAKRLLKELMKKGSLRSDQIVIGGASSKEVNAAVRELEQKLLIHSDQIHTESGSHAKLIESWDHWSSRVGFKSKRMAADEAKRKLEELLNNLNLEFDGRGRLPWLR